MKTLSQAETVNIVGGTEPVSFTAGLLVAFFSAAGYIGKDIYDHWDEFKSAVADGWNNNT